MSIYICGRHDDGKFSETIYMRVNMRLMSIIQPGYEYLLVQHSSLMVLSGYCSPNYVNMICQELSVMPQESNLDIARFYM